MLAAKNFGSPQGGGNGSRNQPFEPSPRSSRADLVREGASELVEYVFKPLKTRHPESVGKADAFIGSAHRPPEIIEHRGRGRTQLHTQPVSATPF